MNNVREIYNENYIGYILEDDSIISSNAISIIQKGRTEGLIKGYLLKQNGKNKIIYPVNRYRNLYSDIKIVNQETFERVLLSVIVFFHRVSNDTILPIECIDFSYQHIFYDPFEKKIRLLAVPVQGDINPNSRKLYENNVKGIMQRYIYDSLYIQSKVCYSLYYDLMNVNISLEDLYNNLISGRYGLAIDSVMEKSKIKPVYQLIPSDKTNPVFIVKDEKTIVGRNFAGEGFALNIQGISRQHSEIVWQADTLYVRDLTSTNGTFVNGTRIFSEQYIPLKVGDKVNFSNVEYEVQVTSNE